ncbi:nwd2 [Moniliophthora roreri]|nr:nwd2 [Moniliophthora roreri]
MTEKRYTGSTSTKLSQPVPVTASVSFMGFHTGSSAPVQLEEMSSKRIWVGRTRVTSTEQSSGGSKSKHSEDGPQMSNNVQREFITEDRTTRRWVSLSKNQSLGVRIMMASSFPIATES